MQVPPFKDIIDDKIAEWQGRLEKLEAETEKAASEVKAEHSGQVDELKATIEGAVDTLRELGEREGVDTIMETKNRILEIFSSIDARFSEFKENTPFML